jgi:hypothetical protein
MDAPQSPLRTVYPDDSPSPPGLPQHYCPPATVPTKDNSEECIEYLNLLCHKLIEKQYELQDKVASQEEEIKTLMHGNKTAAGNSRI